MKFRRNAPKIRSTCARRSIARCTPEPFCRVPRRAAPGVLPKIACIGQLMMKRKQRLWPKSKQLERNFDPSGLGVMGIKIRGNENNSR